MSKWPKVMIAAVMVLALVVVGCAPAEVAAPEEEKTITVGILGALTGPLSAIGYGAVCVHDYWTELNVTEGGIRYMDPQTGKEEVVAIKVMMGDHAWDMAKCVSLYERFKAAGMQFAYANGSAPTAAIYAAAARDRIPGLQVNCTCDPFIYETETEPYLAMDGTMMPVSTAPVVAWYVEQWKREGKPGKPKIGVLAADVATRRVYDNDEDYGFITYAKEVAGADFLGNVYMGVVPVDVKAELTGFIEKGANVILVDHWGAGACRVVLHDALELEMHKKGITLNIEWMPSEVPLAEPELWNEYNKYALVQSLSHGYNGNEPPDVQAQVPGLKKAFDLCAKYQDGQVPELRAGWQYVYGVEYGMLGQQAIKQALEKTGWAGFSTKQVRDEMFGFDPIETGGLLPPYTPPPDIFTTWCMFTITDIIDGHMVNSPERPWITAGPTKVYPDFNITVHGEWKDKVWVAPAWPPK